MMNMKILYKHQVKIDAFYFSLEYSTCRLNFASWYSIVDIWKSIDNLWCIISMLHMWVL